MPDIERRTLNEALIDGTRLFEEWWQDLGDEQARRFIRIVQGNRLRPDEIRNAIKAVFLDGYLMNERH